MQGDIYTLPDLIHIASDGEVADGMVLSCSCRQLSLYVCHSTSICKGIKSPACLPSFPAFLRITANISHGGLVLQAAIFGALAAPGLADRPVSLELVRTSSSDSDERPQVVDLHEISAFGGDVSKHNISKPI